MVADAGPAVGLVARIGGHDLRHAALVHLHHPEIPVAHADILALGRDVAEALEEEPAQA